MKAGDLNSFIEGKTSEEVFLGQLGRKPFFDHPPVFRTQLLHLFAHLHQKRIAYDSERGVNGGLFKGSVSIWNVQEYSPWKISEPVTVVLGDLFLEEENRKGELIITHGATLFVTGDIQVGHLKVLEGEVHCLGAVELKSGLHLGKNGYLSAKKLICPNAKIEGILNSAEELL